MYCIISLDYKSSYIIENSGWRIIPGFNFRLEQQQQWERELFNFFPQLVMHSGNNV